MPCEHYSPPATPIFVKRHKKQTNTKVTITPAKKFLKNSTQIMSNGRQVQTKKCPDGPGEDVFAYIKEKQ